ncbi:MAG: hypothetical protein ACRESN_09195, partial [Pseudomonas sp.]
LAREKRPGDALIQNACVIVDDLREQARSYRWCGKHSFTALQQYCYKILSQLPINRPPARI